MPVMPGAVLSHDRSHLVVPIPHGMVVEAERRATHLCEVLDLLMQLAVRTTDEGRLDSLEIVYPADLSREAPGVACRI